MNAVSSIEYAKSNGLRWTTSIESVSVLRRPPIRQGTIAVDFNAQLVRTLPDLGVVELPRPTLLGPDGLIITQTGELLANHSWYGKNVRVQNGCSIPERKLNGVCLSLASEWAYQNYSHFVLDSIARLRLFELAGYSLDDVDWVYVPEPIGRNAIHILEQTSIPERKMIFAKQPIALRPEVLLAPTYPGVRRNYADFVPSYLRSLMLSKSDGLSRRVYLSRSGSSRAFVDEPAIEAVLESYGFELYDVNASPARFCTAECVVGISGAALANVAFCNPGATVLEIIPTDHVHCHFYTLADSGRLSYNYIVAPSACIRASGAWGPSPHPVQLSPEVLRTALDRILRAANDNGEMSLRS